MERFETPVLFLIFNRPDLTEIVFKRIREVKPKFLFVAADGPRPNHPEDVEKCQKARETVLNLIDWDCELKTLFRDKNLGCGKAVSGAITWFFEHVEEGIILEDDCLPDLSFFGFCGELLGYYRKDDEVMHIGGTNWQLGKKRGNGSYYFSNLPHVWGWATWKRAWEKFSFHSLTDNEATLIFKKRTFSAYWVNLADKIVRENINSWAYYWAFSIWRNQSKCIIPNWNLVKNIGFGHDATHTLSEGTLYKRIPIEKIKFPLLKPKNENINEAADNFTFLTFYIPKNSFKKNFLSICINMFKVFKDILNRSGIHISRYSTVNDEIIHNLKRKEEKYKELIHRSFRFFYHQNFSEDNNDLNQTEIQLISNLEGTNEHEAFYIKKILNETLIYDGDVCEFGVAQGKTSALIAYYLKKTNKYLWLFDSFKGLPKPSIHDVLINDVFKLGNIEAYEGTMSYGKEYVLENLKKANFDHFEIVEGFIENTYHKIPPKVCFSYLDFDFYDPLKVALNQLKSKLVNGGGIIVDDYGYFSSGAQKAVDEFVEENKSDFILEVPNERYGNFCILRKSI